MKRVNMLWLLLESLFVIVFNLIFFALVDGSDLKTSVWISYGFIHFAYLLLILTPLFIRKGKDTHLYRRPLYLITTSYFLVEFVAGIILILISPETIKTTIIIQTILVAIFLSSLLVVMIANEHTADSMKQREESM